MDLVLNVADDYFFTPYVYSSSWPEDEPLRQIIGLMVVTNLGAAILYLGLGTLCYFFVFDHKLMQHPQFLEVCLCIYQPSVFSHVLHQRQKINMFFCFVLSTEPGAT